MFPCRLPKIGKRLRYISNQKTGIEIHFAPDQRQSGERFQSPGKRLNYISDAKTRPEMYFAFGWRTPTPPRSFSHHKPLQSVLTWPTWPTGRNRRTRGRGALPEIAQRGTTTIALAAEVWRMIIQRSFWAIQLFLSNGIYVVTNLTDLLRLFLLVESFN